jgi:two-component system nitrogen regulation response regulator GlnG
MADSKVNSTPLASQPSRYDGKGERLDVCLLVESLIQNQEPAIYRKVSRAMDRAVLATVLRAAKGNQVRASELLGISRTTLRAKLRSLGMAIEKQLLSESEQD